MSFTNLVSLTDDLVLVDTFDRGIPNLERIAVRANAKTEMRGYGLLLGLKLASGSAIPLPDNFFWFGPGEIQMFDWIYIYTKAGQGRTDSIPNTTSKLYSVFWNRPTVVFSNPDIVPILIRIDFARIGEVPKPQNTLPGL